MNQAEYGNNAGSYLHEGEHIAVGCIIGQQEGGAQQQVQGGAAADEDVDNNNEEQYGDGKYVDVLIIAQTSQQDGSLKQSVQKDKFPVVVKDAFFGVVKEYGKNEERGEHQDHLSADCFHVGFRGAQF